MAKTRQSRGSPKEQGAITPILAACLAVGLGLLAMTVDLGQLFVAKNELQNIADAAALAGARKLIQAKDSSTGVEPFTAVRPLPRLRLWLLTTSRLGLP
jgi:Flp pilus assembly protein TadG